MLSAPHLIIVFLVALLVFGPEKLPELARTLSKAMGEFRRLSGDFQETIQREMNQLERDAHDKSHPKATTAQEPVDPESLASNEAASHAEEPDHAGESASAAPEDSSSEDQEVAGGEAQGRASDAGIAAGNLEPHPYDDSYDRYGELHADAAVDEPPGGGPAPAPPEKAIGESPEAVQAQSNEEPPAPDSPTTVNASAQDNPSAATGVELPLNDHPTAA